MKYLERYQKELSDKSLEEILNWALETFGTEHLVLSSSLGVEDQLLTEAFLKQSRKARIFTLDTGRQFSESYDLMQETMDKYGFFYELGFPNPNAVRELIKAKGPNLFYNSIADRKSCCEVRKLQPLREILATAKCWITGLRSGQSVTREEMQLIEWDSNFGLFKINPLLHWTEEEVWEKIKAEEIPYNVLHDKGFPSIGCAPCTRAVKPGEDLRAGRWWWEQPEHKECGLHFDENGNIVRK